jgi:outer membrane protein assembly factor BamB
MIDMPRAQRYELFDDLVQWQTALPGIRHSTLPPHGPTTSNPLVGDEAVFVSTFAPGRLFKLDVAAGSILWTAEIDSMAGASLFFANDLIVARSSQHIVGVERGSGAERWRFTPYPGHRGEWIYSSVTRVGDLLLFGDRCGRMWAIDLDGKRVWWRGYIDGENAQINSHFLSHDGAVIAASNPGFVFSVDAVSGEERWRTRVEGGCISEIVRIGECAVVPTSHGLFAINVSSGQIEWTLTTPSNSQWSYAVVEGGRLVVGGVARADPKKPDLTGWLWFREPDGRVTRRELPQEDAPYQLAPVAGGGLLFDARIGGMGVVDAETGARYVEIVFEETEFGWPMGHAPFVRSNDAFMMSGRGVVARVAKFWPTSVVFRRAKPLCSPRGR